MFSADWMSVPHASLPRCQVPKVSKSLTKSGRAGAAGVFVAGTGAGVFVGAGGAGVFVAGGGAVGGTAVAGTGVDVATFGVRVGEGVRVGFVAGRAVSVAATAVCTSAACAVAVPLLLGVALGVGVAFNTASMVLTAAVALSSATTLGFANATSRVIKVKVNRIKRQNRVK